MHGIIFSELNKYVTTRLGPDAWRSLLREAGLAGKIYLPVTDYPDEEAVQIVTAASRITGTPAAALLDDFGEFIAPDLMRMYRALVKPHWKTLDLLENVENTIHTVVRMKNAGAHPPYLSCTRTGADTVVVRYTSARKLCNIAEGIIRGVAAHYGEKAEIVQTTCMHRGDDACDIRVRIMN